MGSPTEKDLKLLFEYRDGRLVWRYTRNNRAIKGNVAGCTDKSTGYRHVRIDGKKYYGHRLVWEYFNGKIPKGMKVDHINHDTGDNRIENLRLVTHQENHRNQKLRKNNSSGVLGVRFDKARSLWTSRVQVGTRTIHLGRFKTIEAAISARKNADRVHGFHANHGGVV